MIAVNSILCLSLLWIVYHVVLLDVQVDCDVHVLLRGDMGFSRDYLTSFRNSSHCSGKFISVLEEHGICRPIGPNRGTRAGAQVKNRTHKISTVISDRSSTPAPSGQQGANHVNFAPLPKYDLPVFLNVNARSLTKKLDELDIVLSQNQVDICAVTESWLNDTVPEDPVSINGYKFLRNDRVNRVGGGVGVYVNLKIPYKEWTDLEDPNFETKWITLRPHKLPREYPNLLVGIIYHPTTQHRLMTDHIIKSVDHILSHHPLCGIVLLGDFNQLPDNYIALQYKLKQVVTKPTRENATLDKIFTNMGTLFREPLVLPKLGTSDHSMVLMKPYVPNSFNTGKNHCYN